MKKKLVVLLLLLVALSGCTKRFNVENKEDKSKSKSYVSNIICKPESKELLEVYEKNEKKLPVKLEKLPVCKNLKVNSGGYEGLWTSIFVKPLSWVLIKVGLLLKSYGLSIMLIGLLLRAAMFPLSKKSSSMSNNMQKAQKDLDALERKYRGRDDKESMMMKSQEMMAIYKKHDINPLSGCLFALLQIPIFFAFLEAISRVPAFFEQKFLVFNLGMSPKEGFAVGNYWYIILIVLIGLATFFSFKNINTNPTGQQGQTKMMSTIMLVFIVIMSFSLPTAIALYWIVSNGFTIVQNILIKKGK